MSFAGSLRCGIVLIVGDDHAPPACAVTRPIATEIDGNRVQPRPDFAIGLKAWIGAVSAQPGLLEQIGSIVTIAQGAQQVAHNLSFMAAHNLLKRKR
jgi:hypothetical protein